MMDSGTACARLCHIIKWDHFDGYGFNLHAEKGKTGQFIGKVDEGSPSEAAGLRQGDRIIEVNEINIANETHKQVVERIKAFPTETKLLVVDQVADDYFKANNIPIKGTMHGIKYMKTPERNFDNQDDDDDVDNHHGLTDVVPPAVLPANKNTSNGSQGTTSDSHSIASSSGDNHSMSNNSHGKENGNSSSNNNNNNGTSSTTVTTTNNSTMMVTGHEDEDNLSNKSSSSSSNNKDAIQSISANGTTGSLNLLQMSAKELRAKLAQRKKYDPKKESMGFKDKFDIVQKL